MFLQNLEETESESKKKVKAVEIPKKDESKKQNANIGTN